MGIRNFIMDGSLSVYVFGEYDETLAAAFDGAKDYFLKENILIADTPRHADVLLVIPPIADKNAKILRAFYDEMLAPKYVVCADTKRSREKYRSYALINDLRRIIPVNTECQIDRQKGKENLINAFARIKEMIRNDG